MQRSSTRGATLIELLIAASVAAILLTLGLPNLFEATTRLRVRAAAEELKTTLRLAQSAALRHTANVGVKFREQPDGTVTFGLYRDGDGDGVLTADIDRGADPEVQPEHRLENFGRGVGFGFPPGLAPRDPSDPRRRLAGLDDPIRFNGSNIAAFSPTATATPGSIYLTDHKSVLMVVRVTSLSGRVDVLVYDPRSETWR